MFEFLMKIGISSEFIAPYKFSVYYLSLHDYQDSAFSHPARLFGPICVFNFDPFSTLHVY